MPRGRLNTSLGLPCDWWESCSALWGRTAVPFSLIAARRGEQSIFSEAIRGLSALPRLHQPPPSVLVFLHGQFSLLNVTLPLRIVAKPSLVCCVQLLAGYFLLCNSMKRIPFNYKRLISPDSSDISLRPSGAPSGDDYERGIWSGVILRFAMSPVGRCFSVYSELQLCSSEVSRLCFLICFLFSYGHAVGKVLPVTEIFITKCVILQNVLVPLVVVW